MKKLTFNPLEMMLLHLLQETAVRGGHRIRGQNRLQAVIEVADNAIFAGIIALTTDRHDPAALSHQAAAGDHARNDQMLTG